MKYHRLQGRRLARALALEAIYRWDLLREDLFEAIEDAIERENPPNRTADFARELTKSFWQHRERIDQLIREHARNWTLERMPFIDRSILRLAIAELLTNPEVSENMVIDEAVEMAKTFSTDEAGGFVNGVLDAVSKSMHSE